MFPIVPFLLFFFKGSRFEPLRLVDVPQIVP